MINYTIIFSVQNIWEKKCSSEYYAFQNISNLFCTIFSLPFILISQFCIILIRFRSIIGLSLCNYVNSIPDLSYQLFHSYSVLQNIPFSNVYIHEIFCRNKHAFKFMSVKFYESFSANILLCFYFRKSKTADNLKHIW